MSCKVSGVNLPLVWLDLTWAKSSRLKCRILSCFSLLSLALRFLIVILKMALHVCCRFKRLTSHTHTHRCPYIYILCTSIFLRTFIDIIMYEPSPTLIPTHPKFKTKSSPSNSPLQLWGPGLTQMISWEIISASFCYSPTPRKNHPNKLQPVWLSGPKSMPIIASNLYFSQL